MPRNPNTVCSICGKPVYKRPKDMKDGKKVFCGYACYGISQRKYKNCEICGKKFYGHSRKTCSDDCSDKLRIKVRTGLTYENCKGRPLRDLSDLTDNRVIRKRLVDQYGECQRCGHGNTNILQVHHVTKTEYLLLCPNCHYTEHLGDSREGR